MDQESGKGKNDHQIGHECFAQGRIDLRNVHHCSPIGRDDSPDTGMVSPIVHRDGVFHLPESNSPNEYLGYKCSGNIDNTVGNEHQTGKD